MGVGFQKNNLKITAMVTQIESLDELLARIAGMTSIDESNQVREAMRSFKEHASESEHEAARRALSQRLNQLADQFEADINETADVLRLDGKTYSLDNWLTVADYAKKYSLDRHVVDNWIRRGVVPESDVLTLTRINNTRMVKDRVYK